MRKARGRVQGCVLEQGLKTGSGGRRLNPCFSDDVVDVGLFVLQIKGMKERLDFWCGDVKSMAVLVEHQAHDILT